MENTNIPWRWLGGGLLLIIVLVYIVARNSGKKKGSKDTITAPVPDPDHVDPNLDVEGFAKSLHDAMEGVNFTDRGRTDLFRKLYLLNNSEFISVYNTFNTNYGGESTLRQWIEGEYIGVTGDNIKTKLEVRFNSLNLS